ncbi:MAG: hypothetical protein KF744_10330 [Taibaiella sp.]|nr:hypothetical protein [Taibaiella sp.]
MTKGACILVVALFSLTLCSCFTTYQVESTNRVGKDDGHLVVYRKGIVGFAVGSKVYANGKFVGKVGANRYISCWLPEGEYLMSVGFTKRDETFFKVLVGSGRTYAYSFSFSPFKNGGRAVVQPMPDVAVIDHRRPPVVNYFN